jgi:very-short-patch-repair endonuclease
MDIEKYNCKYCGKECKNKNSLIQHEIRCKKNPNKLVSPFVKYNKLNKENGTIWNKGLTKETDESVRKGSEELKRRYANGEIEVWCNGKTLTDDTKNKISESMKKAHSENRAHNIGMSRWNNEPSYPEKWFMSVIENEFDDKDYIREYSFGRFSLDFAWVAKKKCIEIDGEQHQRFQDYKERDMRKDALLKENGWEVLRLIWKDMYNNPKEAIKKAKTFIE